MNRFELRTDAYNHENENTNKNKNVLIQFGTYSIYYDKLKDIFLS